MDNFNRFKKNIKFYSNDELNNISIYLLRNQKTGYENIDKICETIGCQQTHKYINKFNNIMYGGNKEKKWRDRAQTAEARVTELEGEQKNFSNTIKELQQELEKLQGLKLSKEVVDKVKRENAKMAQDAASQLRVANNLMSQQRRLKKEHEDKVAAFKTREADLKNRNVQYNNKMNALNKEKNDLNALKNENNEILKKAQQSQTDANKKIAESEDTFDKARQMESQAKSQQKINEQKAKDLENLQNRLTQTSNKLGQEKVDLQQRIVDYNDNVKGQKNEYNEFKSYSDESLKSLQQSAEDIKKIGIENQKAMNQAIDNVYKKVKDQFTRGTRQLQKIDANEFREVNPNLPDVPS